jgi:hypothetical protein
VINRQKYIPYLTKVSGPNKTLLAEKIYLKSEQEIIEFLDELGILEKESNEQTY